MSPTTPDEESIPPPGTPPVVPTFLLPPERVIITQPTPETEFPTNHGSYHALTITISLGYNQFTLLTHH